MDGKNKLYFGDNLRILRDYVGDASVDLIYLDPPFNSSRFVQHCNAETEVAIHPEVLALAEAGIS